MLCVVYRLISCWILTASDLRETCPRCSARFRDCHRLTPVVHHVMCVTNCQICNNLFLKKISLKMIIYCIFFFFF